MRRTVADCNDCGSQTDRVTVVDDASFKELARIIADQKLQIKKALKENMPSEEPLRELEIELENKYCKHLAIQVTKKIIIKFAWILCNCHAQLSLLCASNNKNVPGVVTEAGSLPAYR